MAAALGILPGQEGAAMRRPRANDHFEYFFSGPIGDALGIANHRRTARERAHVLALPYP